MPHIVFAVTAPRTAIRLLCDQLRFYKAAGWEVSLIAGASDTLDEICRTDGINFYSVGMRREPSPIRDIIALFRLTRLLWRLRPDLISYGTPKASLLCAIAAYLARIPVRVYLLRGLRAEGLKGVKQRIFVGFEQIVSFCSTQILCVSPSLQQLAIEMRAIDATKASVLGSGSSNGIDLERFSKTDAVVSHAREFRANHQLAEDDLVVGFMGRMVRDKGIENLLSAMQAVLRSYPKAKLLLAGPKDSAGGLPASAWETIQSHPSIQWVGLVDDAPAFFATLDIFVLPTRREGLPNVALEAAAMELPLVVSNATGAIDTVLDGETGTVVDIDSKNELENAISHYLSDEVTRRTHGLSARNRVVLNFDRYNVWQHYNEFYRRQVQSSI